MASKYGAASARKVERTIHEMKRGKLRSGRSGRKVKSRKQAIAIGLSEARLRGTLAPDRRASERPIAIACLRFLTLRPERPLRNLPRFIS